MRTIWTTILVFLIALTVQAQTSEEAVNLMEDQTGIGIRAAGMGNAYTGVADDYSAVYWNPAGLAQIRQGQFYVSLQNLNYEDKATYLHETTDGQKSFTKFSTLGFVYPFPVVRGSLVLALGYQRFKSLDSYLQFAGNLTQSNNLAFDISNDRGDYGILDFDRDVQQKQTITNDGYLRSWNIAVAMDLSPNFSAGVTLDFIGGSSQYNRTYSQDDPNGNNSYDIYDDNNQKIEEFYYNYYDLYQKLTTDYSGIGIKVGGMFHITPQIRAGLTVALPYSLTLTETWSKDDELSYDIYSLADDATYNYVEPSNLGDGQFDYKINVPFKFSGGVSYDLGKILVSASAEYQDWTQMEFEKPDNRDERDYTDLLNQNPLFDQNYKATLTYAVGGEVKLFNNSLLVRGGYRYVPSPFKNMDKKYDKRYLSAGVGYRIDRNTVINASYTYGMWEKAQLYDYDPPDWTATLMQTNEKYRTGLLRVGMRVSF